MGRFLNNSDINNPASLGCIIGDSTIAAYLGQTALSGLLLSTSDQLNGCAVVNLAVPGHAIYDQLLKWNASTQRKQFDWIYVEIGLNDLNPAEPSSVALTRYQGLIDKINIDKKPSARVIVGAMTPAKARLIDFYGTTAGATAYQKWIDMNTAIMGGGVNRINGVFHRIDGHSLQLNDGFGNLMLKYDMGDGIHETTEGRRIIASYVRSMLNMIGHLRSVLPPTSDYIKFEENRMLAGEGLALVVVSPDGSVSRGPLITEGFTLESAVISAITGADFVNDRATIAPAGGLVMSAGDKYDDGTYTYIAISDNHVRRF